MWEVFESLFSSKQYIPHGHCYLWQSPLVWLHLISDLLISLAYFSIPVILIYFIYRRNDVPFLRVFALFGAFIVLCGTGHLLEILTLWHPVYWITGFEKAITALVSCYTALQLIELLPQFLALQSPEQLETINQELQRQISVSEIAHQKLQQFQLTLQDIVAGTAPVTGDAFFPALVQNLATALDVRYALVSEVVSQEPKVLKTLALSAGGQTGENFTYDLSGTPCESVIEQAKLCYYPEQIQEHFSTDLLKAMDAICYLGVPLLDGAQQVIGVLCITSDQPLSHEENAKAIITIFAARAAAELQRQRAETALRHAYDELEIRVQKRTAELLSTNAALETEIQERIAAELALQQQAKREQLIAAITQRIHQSLDLEEVLNTTVIETRQLLQTDRVIVFRLNPDGSGKIVVESVSQGWKSVAGTVIYDEYFATTYAQFYRHGRIQAIEDIYTANLTSCHVDLLAKFQVRANLVVPIVNDEQLWGLLVVQQCSRPRQWQPLEIDLLKQLATQAAIVIHQSELYQQAQAEITQRQQTELNLQHQIARGWLVEEVAQRIRQSLNLQEILNTTVQEVQHLLQADRVLLYQVYLDGTGKVITESVAVDYPPILDQPLPEEIFPQECHQAYRQGRVRRVTNVETDDMSPCLADTLRQIGVKSKLVVPILQGENLWGLLIAHQCSNARCWEEFEVELLKHLATHVAIAIAQANLLSQTRQQVQYEATINRISQLLHSPCNVIEIRQSVLDETVEALGGIGGRLYITADSTGQAAQLYTYGAQPNLFWLEESYIWQQAMRTAVDCSTVPAEYYEPIPHGLLSQSVSAKTFYPHCTFDPQASTPQIHHIYSINDLYQDPQLRPLAPAFEFTSIRSILIVPLQYQKQHIGYLSIFRQESDSALLWAGISHKVERNVCSCQSFETWEEIKRGTKWSQEDIKLAQALGTHLYMAVMQRRVEDAMRYQASHDFLTGLPNRLLFNEQLALALEHACQHGEMLAVMFLDLDRFKSINDTLGHAIGDHLLQQVAQRIAKCLKQSDTIARWGGDEFTLILPRMHSAEDVTKIAQRILKTLKAPFNCNQQELHITTSIGIALAPYDGEDAETLLKNADTAMYRAKQQGKNSFQLYAPDMNTEALEHLVLVNDLYKALDRGEFLLYYQPQVSLQTGQIIAMEALIRWKHPERGLVSPSQFIPIAEETGQISAMGEWVLQTACAQNRAWQIAGLPPIRIAVNLSARQFQQQNLARLIAQVLLETGLEARYLEIEITESIAMQDLFQTVSILKELQAIGVHISIDDFGTGYSSLATLKRFPLHTLKVDREFVKDLTTNSKDAAVIQAIVALAHGLNLEVVAEGVETLEQWNFLCSINCDATQGFFFSKPLSAQDATHFVSMRL